MTDNVVLFERRGAVAIVTLNRPEVRNALNPEVLVRLDEAWTTVREDDDIRVAIVTGTGAAFCSGADLGQLVPLLSGARQPEDRWDQRVAADPALPGRGILRDGDVTKPVIAAINGFAIAGGMELIMGCDIRIAAAHASLGLQEAKWGLFPAGGSTVRLPRQMPYARAMELLLTGDLIDSSEALELGFLNHVVAAEKLLSTAFEIAARIAANGPVAVRAIRKAVQANLGLPEVAALKQETEIGMPVFATEDAREGPLAFMEKRPPVFKGR